MHTVQTWTREENEKYIFHISDEINANLFSLEEAESVRRMLGDRSNLAESVRVRPRSTETTSLVHQIR